MNPYQQLTAEAIENAGAQVVRIPPRKLFPLHWAASNPIDLLHLDWPHDCYTGRNWPIKQAKRFMYYWGCRRLRRLPVVWTAHNMAAHDSPSRAYEQRMLQQLIDSCNGIVAMSNAASDALRSRYRISDATRVAVIPHGHYVDAYPNFVTQREARQRLNIASNAKVILFFGRIRPYKGVEELIRVFRSLEHPAAMLLIAGEPHPPEFADQLIELARQGSAKDDIRFVLQSTPRDDVQLYFNACDVVALPFREILNSGTVMLALSFGRCVITPKMGSLPEIAPELSCFSYAPNDNQGLTNSLIKALGSSDLQPRGESARRHVLSTCGWDSIGAKLVNLYRSIITP